MKILIVEDDNALANAMKNNIISWNYDVHCVHDFQKVTEEFENYNPHLVLLDIMLPFFNGYHWCTEIRKLSNVPIIFISSASDNMNIVMAMNMGGDDFLAKPVDINVMIAKIQAILRRTYDMSDKSNVILNGEMALNLDDASLIYSGQRIELTKNEFRILQTLLENKGKVVSRDTLMIKLWQIDCYIEENTLTVNVNRLRKKLEGYGLYECIKTRTGSGYIIEE